ncbi:MAG TPA: metallophosphoesterase, partial [Acidobacteriota bacterium]|nr:metallophosphoesterase [Acidobacteriota bacterium]
IMLEDSAAMLPSVQLIGASYDLDKHHHEKVLDAVKIAKDKPSVFLYHTPTDLTAAVKHNIDLQLAGHTHRGQIWPFRLLVRLNFKYVYGQFREKNSFIYVAPGSATWGPKMKLGSHNEITLHIIEPIKK